MSGYNFTANDIAAILDENADADERGLHNASQLAEKIYQMVIDQDAIRIVAESHSGELRWLVDDERPANELLVTISSVPGYLP